MMKHIWIVILTGLSVLSCEKSVSPDHELLISYLKMNNSIIDTSSTFIEEEFVVLDSCIEDYSVFLFGESHAIYYNEIIDVKLLKYLYYHAGVRYYLSESSYSNSALINKYVQTGDLVTLDYVYFLLREQGTLSGNFSSYDKWRKIHEFNASLPENEKITIVGIDVEHQVDAAFYWLNSILPGSQIPDEIFNRIEEIKNYQGFKTDEAKYRLGCQLLSDIKSNREAYVNYLGENYFDFHFVVSNLANTYDYKFPDRDSRIRESIIYRNFKEIHTHLPNARYYGKWGREHVLQEAAATKYTGIDEPRFAMYLDSDTSVFCGEVLSIVGTYLDCRYLSNYKGFQSKPYRDEYDDQEFIGFDDSKMQLLKLDNAGSPFIKELFFLDQGVSNSTTDYFQYILKISHSPACEEFDLLFSSKMP